MTESLSQSLQIAVGLLLLVAGAAKFLELAATPPYPQPWASVLRRAFSTRHVTYALSLTEAVIGSALVVGMGARSVRVMAAVAAAGLFAAYSVWLAMKLRSSKGKSCNCFGRIARSTVNGFTLGRNVVLVISSMWLAATAGTRGEHPDLVSGALGSALAAATIWLTHVASKRSAPAVDGAADHADHAGSGAAVTLPTPVLATVSEEGS